MASVGAHDKVCLVIAHPDDEVMFFTPTLAYLKRTLKDWESQMFLFCCTHGARQDGINDAEEARRGNRPKGISKNRADHGVLQNDDIRGLELVKCATQVFQIPLTNVLSLDRPELRDGFHHLWDTSLLVKELGQFANRHKISWMLTFDRKGVSSHPNHCCCWRACVDLMGGNYPHVAHLKGAIQISTLPLGFKYLGLLGAVAWIILRNIISRTEEYTHVLVPGYATVFRGMSCHKSQFVWFRYLFVMFSTYSIFNELSLIDFNSIHVK